MLTRRGIVAFVAALVVAGTTARLGVWQLDRAAQKRALQRSLDEQRAKPALSFATLPRDAAAVAAALHRNVSLAGRWRPEATVLLDNRMVEGRTGFVVVTPLELPDGSALAVERGWLPRDPRDRTRVAPFPTPGGMVEVAGRVAATPSRRYEFERAASEVGAIRQNLDLSTYAREHRLELLPWVLRQEGGAADDGLVRHWPAPAVLDVHKNYGYALQWFAMSALAVFLYVWFAIVRPRRRA